MKLRNLILATTLGIAVLLLVFKAVMLILPVVGTGLTAFLVLAAKAYLGRKIGKTIEDNEDKIKEKVTQ